MIEFNLPLPLVLGLLVSTILPLIVGLVNKSTATAGVKAVWLAALAAVTGLLAELANAITAGVVYDLGQGLILALGSFLVAAGLHFGIYKPTGAAQAVQAIGSKPLLRRDLRDNR